MSLRSFYPTSNFRLLFFHFFCLKIIAQLKLKPIWSWNPSGFFFSLQSETKKKRQEFLFNQIFNTDLLWECCLTSTRTNFECKFKNWVRTKPGAGEIRKLTNKWKTRNKKQEISEHIWEIVYSDLSLYEEWKKRKIFRLFLNLQCFSTFFR